MGLNGKLLDAEGEKRQEKGGEDEEEEAAKNSFLDNAQFEAFQNPDSACRCFLLTSGGAERPPRRKVIYLSASPFSCTPISNKSCEVKSIQINGSGHLAALVYLSCQ